MTDDLRKAVAAVASGFNYRAERRAADVQHRRLPAQTERVGDSFIVVTCFD